MTTEYRIDPKEWEFAVARADGPQLVVGGPGTGKTEFLVRRALWLLEDADIPPEKILLLSFSRRGVADLKSRVRRGLARSYTVVPASTFHSLAARLLESYSEQALGWTDMPSLLTGPEQVALIHEMLVTEEERSWPLPFRSLLTTNSFAEEVADFLLRCQEQLIKGPQLAELARRRSDWKGLPEFLIRYEQLLLERNRIDYGTLLGRAVELLDHVDIAEAVGAQFRYLLVDEYQDTTNAQVRLLRGLYASHHNLTVSADPYQSIYSFRGADLANVLRFPTDFPDADGRPAERITLTTSFRVPAAILAAAERVTAGSLPGSAGPVTPAQGEGRVDAYLFDQQTQEAEWIAEEIDRLHLEEQIPFSQMAVFVRSKRRFLPELSRVLERRRIPHDLPDSRLADHPAVRLILDCVIAATQPQPEAGRALRRILLGPLFSIPLGRLREIERDRLRSGAAWAEVLTTRLEDGEGLASLLEETGWATRRPAVEGFWHIWETLPQFVSVVEHPHRRDERAAWSSLAQVLGRLYERDPLATLVDYVRLTDDEEFEARPLLSYRAPRQDHLTLTTLHQSKGLEFDTVFIADAVEGVFPDLRSRESLLGSRHLSPSLPADPIDYRAFRLQEETRLAYTAMTRGYRRVIWTATSSGLEMGHGMPSRFLPLVAGVDSISDAVSRPPERTNPVTALEAEAWLRRIVRDPGQGRPRRLAALSLLGAGNQFGLRSPTVFAGIRERGPDDGIVTETLTLSPSQAESYATCPRRYVFERRLHVGDDSTPFLTFGTLIHGTLERAEAAALQAKTNNAGLSAALEELDSMWDPSDFKGEPWSTAWYRRAVDIITYLYDHWPSRGVPIALERPLTLDVDGVLWRGKADRVELDDGVVRVVDYKTGSRIPTLADASISMQLGFYLLALRADEHISESGRVEEAELWFPANTEARSVTVRRFDTQYLARVKEAMREAARGIAAEEWTATPNPYCDRCRVRIVCPEWPEGREAFSS
ncbi:MAG: ATP-dependent helicase [Acidimicrobiia bacterium]|nr:ATP-dependent helicase [Acidimicrobiia bacterium]